MNGSIGVLPIGKVPETACSAVAAHVRSVLGLEAAVLAPLAEPDYAFDRNRMQYNAATILRTLEAMPVPGCTKIVAVLNVDLFVPVFTHVFGEAREGGPCALVSLYRLGQNLHPERPPGPQILDRLLKVALHEAAHLFDLVHCFDDQCLMHFSMDLEALDRLPLSFCPTCKALLK